MNIYEKILEEINSDDWDTEHLSGLLEKLYFRATEDEKKTINATLTILCGWSFPTLLNKIKI